MRLLQKTRVPAIKTTLMMAMPMASPILAPLDMPSELWEFLPVSSVCASDDRVEVTVTWACDVEELGGADVYFPVSKETQ